MSADLPARVADLVAVDFESTGSVPGYLDQPWQIGLVLVRNAEVVMEAAFTSYLFVDEKRPFNPCAPGSWRLVRHELASAPELSAMLPVLRNRVLNVPLIAHHAATEKKILRHAWPLQRTGPWIDTLKLSRLAFPELRSHKLEDVVTASDVKPMLARLVPDRLPHDALYDAVACALVLCYLLKQPTWRDLTVGELTRAVSGRASR